MAWTVRETQGNDHWENFSYFASGGANGALAETINEANKVRLAELRIHMSVAFASTETLTVLLSSIKGSAYNQVLFSHAMAGSTDVRLLLSEPMQILSDDQLIISLSMASGVNTYGLNAIGWAVIG